MCRFPGNPEFHIIPPKAHSIDPVFILYIRRSWVFCQYAQNRPLLLLRKKGEQLLWKIHRQPVLSCLFRVAFQSLRVTVRHGNVRLNIINGRFIQQINTRHIKYRAELLCYLNSLQSDAGQADSVWTVRRTAGKHAHPFLSSQAGRLYCC